MINVNAVLQTSGGGYWSNTAKAVTITGLSVGYINEDADFGELCVYFNDSWDVYKDGLIYTDKGFISDLQNFLTLMGLDGNDVHYSEQGMQGDEYVSCDVGEKFIASWKALFESEFKRAYDDCNS